MARGSELAVGYVSLVAETSQLSQGINRALGKAGDQAQGAGRRMGDQLGRGATAGFSFRPAAALAPGVAAASSTGRQMGQSMGTQTAAAFKQFMNPSVIAGGLVGVTAAVGLAMTSAVRSGNEFQTNLNRLQGASQATASEMAQVAARAKELGNDTQLVGTSAQDAAAAMTELVKGGFDVSQAMSAARGTLQLAAAAQVDAATAATIQADALHAFGLEADQAARVADVLANVANASTGEMGDFAYGFQMGGAVMNQFGISVEDAAASLGLLANAGIKGSDAGTLVKSMLLAIASPSDPASSAMDDLGLKVWDATGAFVGMRSVLEQLQVASERMTPEMYAMATSTAFGSDAARLAGVAAQQGGEGFDIMRMAVERQGAASELAAANTQGLPGVFERLANTTDRAKLSLFELIDGPIASMGNALNEGLNTALDALESGGGPLGGLVDSAMEAWPAIQGVAQALLQVAGVVGSAAWSGLQTVLETAGNISSAVLVPALQMLSGILSDQTGLVAALAGAWAFHRFLTPGLGRLNDTLAAHTGRLSEARVMAKSFGDEMKLQQNLAGMQGQELTRWGAGLAVVEAHSPAIQRMGDAYRSSAAQGTILGRSLGTVKAGLSGIGTAATAATGLLGGPLAAAFLAVTTAVTLMASSSGENTKRLKELDDIQGKLTASSRDLFEELGRSGGEVSEGVIAKTTEQVELLDQRLNVLRTGAGAGDWLSSFNFLDMGALDKLNATLEKQGAAENVERIKTAMNDLGVTAGSMGVLVSGSADAWEQFTARAMEAGDGGEQLLAVYAPLREEFLASKEAAANLTPGIVSLKDQIEILADTTSTAEEKTNALKTALDLLAGKTPDIAASQKTYDDTMRATGEATQEVIDQTKGFGDALTNMDGSVNTSTANGSKLYERLQAIKDATIGVASSGGDLQAAFRNNSAQFRQLADQLGLTEPQVRRMAEALGLVPERIVTLVAVEGQDEAVQELAAIKTELTALPPNTPVTVDALTQEAQTALEGVGATVERLPDNKGVRITPSGTGDTIAALQSVIDTMMNVPSELTITSALRQLGGFNPTSFANAGDAQAARRGTGPDRTAQQGYLPYDPASAPPLQPRADGGSVTGGISGQDSVPSLLMPDEHIWTTKEVRGAGGHQNVAQLRAMAAAGLLRPFEKGGPVAPMDPRVAAIDAAYRNSGRPYDYGPWDCSMYMSSIWSSMSGAGPGRQFTTESDFEALGFKKGYKPGALNIGIRRGGGGKNSHMAGTLPNGVNVENSSMGSVYGPAAAGAQDFPLQYYYEGPSDGIDMLSNPTQQPGEAGSPQSDRNKSGGAPKTPDFQNGSAISTGASEATLAKVGSPAEDPSRTEGYIPAGAGNTAPAGSGLVGGLSGLAVQGINGAIDMAASAAAMGANAMAPGAGAGVQMGADVAKRVVQYGGEMVGIWGDALIEQLTPFGAPRWLSTSPASFMPQTPGQAAATTTLEEGAQAAKDQAAGTPHMPPKVPGMAPSMGGPPSAVGASGAAAALTKQPGVVAPAPGVPGSSIASGQGTGPAPGPAGPEWLKFGGIFDQGGVLQPGSVGANLGTTPEMVLTQDQWDAVAPNAARAPLEPGQESLDFSTHIGAIHGMDPDKLKADLDSRGRLAMMRYAGRHSK